MAAIALVAMDAAHGGTCELFEIGDDGTKRMAVVRAAVQGFGMRHELPSLWGGWLA